VSDLPKELGDWMDVNPRIPKVNKRDQLQGPVAKAIMDTLRDDPEKFALKNQGIYLLVKQVEFKKQEGGQGFVHLLFDNPEFHGLVNGGHTYLAIRQVLSERESEESDSSLPLEAYVRVHIFEGIEEDLITDIAEGLNRSLQVNNPSLANLAGKFEEIKSHLKGKPGEDQIAYHQGHPGEIDIQEVLSLMSLLDLSRFPDRKTHPNILFGQPKKVLEYFIEDQKKEQSVFGRTLPKLHEILVLSDLIQQRGVLQDLGRLKVTNSKKAAKGGDRVRSPKNLGRPAHFAGGTIEGLFHLGWLYPMLAAFRANISRSDWEKGELKWLMEPKQLLEIVIEEMSRIIKQEHIDNKAKPAEVGKKEASYRACFSEVALKLAERGLLPQS